MEQRGAEVSKLENEKKELTSDLDAAAEDFGRPRLPSIRAKKARGCNSLDLKNEIDELKRALKLREKQLGAVLALSDESASELVRL